MKITISAKLDPGEELDGSLAWVLALSDTEPDYHEFMWFLHSVLAKRHAVQAETFRKLRASYARRMARRET